MLFKQEMGFRGSYHFIVKRGNGEVEELGFKNDILDNFFNMLSGTTKNIRTDVSIKLGSGTSPTVFSQTELENPITVTSWPRATNTDVGSKLIDSDTKIYTSRSWTADFGLGKVVGNVSEVGIDLDRSYSADNATVHARALIKDSQGQPTTITVTSQDQLYITYKLELIMDAADSVTQAFLDNNGIQQQVTLTSRWYGLGRNIGDYSLFDRYSLFFASGTSLNPIGQTPTTTQNEFIIVTGTGSQQFNVDGGRVITYRLKVNEANFTDGISFIYDRSYVVAKYKIDPPIPKTSDHIFEFSIYQKFTRI